MINGGFFGAIDPRFGVTYGPVNLAAHAGLGAQGWTSQWGGQQQYNTFDNGYSPLNMALSQDILSPFNMSQINPLLIGITGPMSPQGYTQGASFESQLQQVQQTAYQQGVEIGAKIALDLDINNVKDTIKNFKALLEKNAKDKNLNTNQRDRMIQLIDQLEDAQRRLETVELLRKQGATNVQAKEAVNGIKQQIAEIQDIAAGESAAIQKELQAIVDKKGIKIDDADVIEAEDDEDEVDNSEEVDDSSKPDKSDEADKEKAAPSSICKDMFDAMDGWIAGTDNGKLEAAMDNIDEDNVIEVMNFWNENYKDKNDESLTKMFMWDATHGQKKTYCEKLVAALEKRAEITKTDVSEQAKKVREQIDSWWINNNKVTDGIDAMYDAIVKAESSIKAAEEEETEEAA